MITAEELRRIMPVAGGRADDHVNRLNATMLEFEVNNPLREAAFIASWAVRSQNLTLPEQLENFATEWHTKNLNTLADRGDFLRITKSLITGATDYKVRLDFYERAKATFE